MRLLVSAGGTQEPWDEVRFLGNRSTGRQGCEVARAALDSGAEVTLVAANVNSTLVPGGVSRLEAPTAQDMLRVMLAQQPEADLVVQCAAVADFRPIRVPGKITRSVRRTIRCISLIAKASCYTQPMEASTKLGRSS